MSLVGAWIAVMSVLYPLAMFRGLEPYSGYWGNTYQAVHPGSFPNDAFMSPGRPTMQSLVYGLMRIGGDWWLDDRVTFFLFMGLTAVALIGIDKTARLLGARKPAERVAMLSLMLLGHQILNNHAFAIDCLDFNPTIIAAPAIIWLLYAGLAGAGPRRTLPLMLLTALISVKSAAMPVLITLALMGKERLGARGRRVTVAAALGVAAAALILYAVFLRPADGSQAWVFDHLVREDPSEVNPFRNPIAANALFLALCAAGVRLQGPVPAVWARVRVVAVLGMAVWLAGGLYASWAPDALKIPHLAAFQATRMLWWAQYVLYLALGVALLHRLQRARSWTGVAAAWALLMALYLLHNTFHAKLAAVAIGVSVAMATIGVRKSGTGTDFPALGGWKSVPVPDFRVRAVAAAMAVGVLTLYGVGTLHRRTEALRCLARHGIMGDNAAAKWVGVNEYITRSTSPSATILALSANRGEAPALAHDGSLRVRTGRSMVFGHVAGLYFDAAKMRWYDEQGARITALLAAWERQAPEEVSRSLAACGRPDYVVAPTARSEWLRGHPEFPYAVETVIGEFTVLRRRS